MKKKLKVTIYALMLCLLGFGFSHRAYAGTVDDDDVVEEEVTTTTTNEDDDEDEDTNTNANMTNEDEDEDEDTKVAPTKEINVSDAANEDADEIENASKSKVKSENDEIEKSSNVLKNKRYTDWTVSSYNTSWVPYWYYWSVINNQGTRDMPKKHDANVKTSAKNVKQYKKYMQSHIKQKNDDLNHLLSHMVEIIVIILIGVAFLGVISDVFA